MGKQKNRKKALKHKLLRERWEQRVSEFESSVSISSTLKNLGLTEKNFSEKITIQGKSGSSKTRKRAKALRHKLRQDAKKNKSVESELAHGLTDSDPKESVASSFSLDFYKQQLSEIERQYNQEVERYIEKEVRRRTLEKKDKLLEEYHVKQIAYVDYVKELQNLGLTLDYSDVRVIPDLSRVRLFVSDWLDEYRTIVQANNEGYSKIMDEGFDEEQALKEATKWFIQYQDDVSQFRKFNDHLYGVMYDTIVEYRREVESIVF